MPDDRPIGLTLYEKNDVEPLSKRIMLKDGMPVSDGSVCWMAEGRRGHVEIGALSELAPLLAGLTSQQALSLGTIRLEDRPGGRTDPGRHREVLSGDAGHGAPQPQGSADRADEGIRRYEDDKPALLLIDFDRKGMPDAVRGAIGAAGGFWR